MLKLSSRELSLENNFFFKLKFNALSSRSSFFSLQCTQNAITTLAYLRLKMGVFFFNPSHCTFPRTGWKEAGCGSVRISWSLSSYLFPCRIVSGGCRMPWSWFQGNGHIAGDKHLFVYRSCRTVLGHKYKQGIHDPVFESVETSIDLGDRHAN